MVYCGNISSAARKQSNGCACENNRKLNHNIPTHACGHRLYRCALHIYVLGSLLFWKKPVKFVFKKSVLLLYRVQFCQKLICSAKHFNPKSRKIAINGLVCRALCYSISLRVGVTDGIFQTSWQLTVLPRQNCFTSKIFACLSLNFCYS